MLPPLRICLFRSKRMGTHKQTAFVCLFQIFAASVRLSGFAPSQTHNLGCPTHASLCVYWFSSSSSSSSCSRGAILAPRADRQQERTIDSRRKQWPPINLSTRPMNGRPFPPFISAGAHFMNFTVRIFLVGDVVVVWFSSIGFLPSPTKPLLFDPHFFVFCLHTSFGLPKAMPRAPFRQRERAGRRLDPSFSGSSFARSLIFPLGRGALRVRSNGVCSLGLEAPSSCARTKHTQASSRTGGRPSGELRWVFSLFTSHFPLLTAASD